MYVYRHNVDTCMPNAAIGQQVTLDTVNRFTVLEHGRLEISVNAQQ